MALRILPEYCKRNIQVKGVEDALSHLKNTFVERALAMYLVNSPL
jgi:hypothetical protein